jgi:anti-anti-sigma factor
MSTTRFPMFVTEVRGRTVVTFPVEVDVCNAAIVRDRLFRVFDTGASPLILDLTRTRFCDCAGVSAIIWARRRAADLGTPLCVVLPPTGIVRRIAAVTGLSRQAWVMTGLAAAHRALREEPDRFAPRPPMTPTGA